MPKRTRQTTLDSPAGEIQTLKDIDWTFEGADTTYYTHGLHSYPARMIPQIPDALLNYYKQEGVIKPGDMVYDPFSGSGTTAVEARLHGLNAEANDINPLACILSRTKATPLEMGQLRKARDTLLDGLSNSLGEIRKSHDEGSLEFENEPEVRDGWFPEPQLYELWEIRSQIDELEQTYSREITRFFRVVLSSVTRDVSYQRNGEYKRYRMAEEDREDHAPNVYHKFQAKLSTNLELMEDFSARVDHSLSTTIHYADSRTATENPGEEVAVNSADVVITSPPYGDHSTTVAYGQFSQDPAIIAASPSYDEMRNVDKIGLGGSKSELEPIDALESWSPSFSATLEKLRAKDGRADDAMDFVRDYYEVMAETAEILKPGQPAAWVVANRTMSRVNIPTHLITRELCEHLGYNHEVTLPREIPTKTLPWENAPENVEGTKGDLMANENIVIMSSPS